MPLAKLPFVAKRFVLEAVVAKVFVEVEFVIVAKVRLSDDNNKFASDKFVIVALVNVAFVILEFPKFEIFAKRFVALAVVAKKFVFVPLLAKAVKNVAVLPVILATVVEPSVVDPVERRFPNVPNPVTFNTFAAKLLPVRFVTVVDASVEDPVVSKFAVVVSPVVFVVIEFEVEALLVDAFDVVKFPLTPNKVWIVPRAMFAKVEKKFVDEAVVENEFVCVAFVITTVFAFKLFAFTVFPAIVVPVKFETVVEAKVAEAVVNRFAVVVKPVVFVVEALVVLAFAVV